VDQIVVDNIALLEGLQFSVDNVPAMEFIPLFQEYTILSWLMLRVCFNKLIESCRCNTCTVVKISEKLFGFSEKRKKKIGGKGKGGTTPPARKW